MPPKKVYCCIFIYVVYYVASHCINISLFIYVPIDEHLDCSQFEDIMNKAICVKVFMWTCVFISLGVYLGVELLGHMVTWTCS